MQVFANFLDEENEPVCVHCEGSGHIRPSSFVYDLMTAYPGRKLMSITFVLSDLEKEMILDLG